MAELASPDATASDERGDAPTRTFEDWAREKLPCNIDASTGRATGVGLVERQKGRPATGKFRRLHPSATHNAALVNAARSYHKIPIGKTMTETEFDDAIGATRAIEIR